MKMSTGRNLQRLFYRQALVVEPLERDAEKTRKELSRLESDLLSHQEVLAGLKVQLDKLTDQRNSLVSRKSLLTDIHSHHFRSLQLLDHTNNFELR